MGTKTISFEGRTVIVPDDFTDAEIATALSDEQPKEIKEPKREYAATEVPGAAVSNVGKNLGEVATGIGHAIANPAQTIGGLLSTAGLPISVPYYGILKGLEAVGYPKGSAEGFKSWAMDPGLQVGQGLVDRWGGWLGGEEGWGFTPGKGYENVKRTLAEKPVEAVLDATMLAPAFPKLAKFDPAALPAKAVEKVREVVGKNAGKAADWTAARASEGVYGAHTDVLRELFEAGKLNQTDVRDVLRGKKKVEQLLPEVRDALGKLYEQKNADYLTNMQKVQSSSVPVDVTKVQTALDEAMKVGSFVDPVTGQVLRVTEKNPSVLKARDAIRDEVHEWLTNPNPAFRTAYGFDQLKQSIYNIADAIPLNDTAMRPGHVYANKVAKAVRDTISEIVPEYGEMMKKYGGDAEMIRELKKEFSLGEKSTNQAAIKKLQQTFRKTAGTGHGEKLDLLRRSMDKAGFDTIVPQLAAEQMSSWHPRGLRGVGLPAAELFAGVTNPSLIPQMIALATATSPRVAGEMAYNAGRLRSATERAFNRRPALSIPGEIATEAGRATSAVSPYAVRYSQSFPEERRRGGHLRSVRSR
jgi:hypothetical protein